MSEVVQIEARLVGNVTGNVYAQNQMTVQTIFKEPELYAGDCLLSIPMYPVEEEVPPFSELAPADTQVILQFRTNSANTRLGRSPENPFPYIGRWRGWIDVRARGEVEIPNSGKA